MGDRNSDMSKNRIDELKSNLKIWRELYYNLDPLVSDQEFDAAKDELSRLSPNDEEVMAIGAPPPQISVWEKVRHEIPMGSLAKANSEKELDDWASKTQGVESWIITHKIDGSSMELVYQEGKLVRCVTRGDGVIGEDVTANISKVPSVPSSLTNPIDIIVRGEIVMMKDVFTTKYAEEYANPRNTAAGKVREKKGEGEACRDLEFLAYWVHFEKFTDRPETLFSSMGLLAENGFKTPPFTKSKEINSIKRIYTQEASRRDEIPYEIDGMVVSIDDLSIIEEMGSIGGRPRGQIAWKFDPATRETRVMNVKWQVGNSGRITPVAVVEPIEVGGVTITNISLHNLSMFRDLKLRNGSRVLVSRRNDVIPYIEKNLDE